ncbi:tetratricopeptide repeat protein [Nocardia tengchongensis]|uniref:tetratricopeptide repeat protein n=1 Tax=Nocardia tengchongensis TaxID=2055889 RepID=UPI0036C86D19
MSESSTIIATALALGALAHERRMVAGTVDDSYSALATELSAQCPRLDLTGVTRAPDSEIARITLAEEIEAEGVAADTDLLVLAQQLIAAVHIEVGGLGRTIGVDLDRIHASALRLGSVDASASGVRVSNSQFRGDVEIGMVRSGGRQDRRAKRRSKAHRTARTQEQSDPSSQGVSVELTGVVARDIHIDTQSSRHSRPKIVVVGRIPREPSHFVARQAMQRLREELSDHGSAVLTGFRGGGKTQLAAAYVREALADGCMTVGWIDAETPDSLLADMAAMAEWLHIADPVGDSAVSAGRVRDYLSASRDSAVLVLDNVTDVDLISPLLPTVGRTRILITSTDRGLTLLGRNIDVGAGYTRAESCGYLAASTGLSHTAATNRLAEMLGDLPLALAAAAATMARKSLTYEQYTKLLVDYPLPKVLESIKGHDYPYPVTRAIRMSIDTAESAGDTAVQSAVRRVLATVAMLSPSGVQPRFLPESDGMLDEAIRHCVEGSLLTWSAGGDVVIMHRLAARVLRERAQYDPPSRAPAGLRARFGRRRAPDATSKLVNDALDGLQPHLLGSDIAWTHRDNGSHLIAHIEGLWATGLCECDNKSRDRALAQRIWAFRHLVEVADPIRAISVGTPLVEDLERCWGATHPQSHDTRTSLASAMYRAGRLDDALALAEQSLADSEVLLGPRHLSTLKSRDLVASFYTDAGKMHQAIAYAANILTTFEQARGHDHLETLTACHSLAGVYKAAGLIDKALVLAQRATAGRARLLGPDHYNTLRSQMLLANIYRAAGQPATAVELHLQTLAIWKRTLGEDHPEALITRSHLAEAYRTAGRYQDALRLNESLVKANATLFHPDHPENLLARNDLANAYQLCGRMSQAISLYRAVLEDRRRVLGADHYETLRTASDLVLAYGRSGQFEKAIALGEQVVADRERVLGPSHPDTFNSRDNLVTAYRRDGRWATAAQLYDELYHDREAALGPEHPQTLESRIDAAEARGYAGYPALAIASLLEVHSHLTESLGAEHQLTLSCIHSLAAAYNTAGQRQRALALLHSALPTSIRVLPENHWLTTQMRQSIAALQRPSAGPAPRNGPSPRRRRR